MTARQCISCGLIAGLTYNEILQASPGFVFDMYAAKQRYDDEQHGIRRKNPCAWEDE